MSVVIMICNEVLNKIKYLLHRIFTFGIIDVLIRFIHLKSSCIIIIS